MRDMRLTIPSTDVVREELDKYNYEDWSEVVQAYLIAHGLWDVVEPGNSTEAAYETKNINTAPEVETSKPNYDYNWKEDKRNAAALHAIKISCGPKALCAIRGIHSAQEAWRILAEKFKPPCYIKFEGFKEENCDAEYDAFFEAVETNEWEKVKQLYTINPNLLKARFKRGNRTALHYAVFDRENVEIVKDMIDKMSAEDLKMKESVGGCTALLLATITGSVDMVKSLADGNPDLLGIASNADWIPVEMALCYGYLDVTRYLYDATKQLGILSLGKYWVNFIARCISRRTPEMLDMASELLDAEKNLAIAKDRTGKTPLYIVACSPFLFADGHELRFFKQWIYDFIISKRPTIAAKNNGESAQQVEDLEHMGSPTDRNQISPPSWSDMTTNKKSDGGVVAELESVRGVGDDDSEGVRRASTPIKSLSGLVGLNWWWHWRGAATSLESKGMAVRGRWRSTVNDYDSEEVATEFTGAGCRGGGAGWEVATLKSSRKT